MSTLNLDTLVLESGGHSRRENGVCLLEAVAWYAGKDHSDAPPCVSPVLRMFGTRLNDVLGDERRQLLKPLIPRLVGTTDDGQDEARSYMALDWLVRTYAPAWLDLAGLTTEAQSLRNLRRIVDMVAAESAGPAVRATQAAAWAAAGAAVGAAVGAAARAAVGAAVGAAAWAAAGDAAGDAAWAAAWAAARAAARDAAWAAARAAARDAAGDAAGDVLRPTVDALQVSAIALYSAMIDPSSAVRDAGA